MKISKYKQFYMDVAVLAAGQSVAERLRVGCSIVTGSGGMFTGFNGTPPGWHTNLCEDVEYANLDTVIALSLEELLEQYPYIEDGGSCKLTTKPEVLHAERNALNKMLAEGISSRGASVFVTHQPCMECALSLVGAQVKEVFYLNEYRCQKGVDLMRQAGIIVTRM